MIDSPLRSRWVAPPPPGKKSRSKTLDGLPSDGIRTPPRVHERLSPPELLSVSEGNRVSVPIRSAIS